MIQHELGAGTMLVITCETPLAERLTRVLDELGVVGYTRFSGVSGIGATGRHEGTAVWPGTNTVIFSFVRDRETAEAILQRNEEVISEVYERRPGYRAFLLPAEGIV